jgi:hypothetical protein
VQEVELEADAADVGVGAGANNVCVILQKAARNSLVLPGADNMSKSCLNSSCRSWPGYQMVVVISSLATCCACEEASIHMRA